MTVLVTGATGFLGSRLAALLCDRGENVRVLVRPTSDRRRITNLPVTAVEGDITDRPSVEAALAGAERAYHCAALYEFGTPDPALMERINVGGTANVIEAAAERDIRVVHVSSVVAHGSTGPQPADESHWRGGRPGSDYEDTKRRAHQLAQRMAAEGAPVRIASPGTIYGPDDPSMVGLVHQRAVRGLPVGILADTRMSLVHVDDCAAGLVLVAERGRDGEDYILGGQVASFREWLGTLAEASGHRPPRFYVPDPVVRAVGPVLATVVPYAPVRRLLRDGVAMSDGKHWAFTSAKAERELGWRHRTLAEGMADVAAWYGAAAASR